jgi:hypothetical protein
MSSYSSTETVCVSYYTVTSIYNRQFKRLRRSQLDRSFAAAKGLPRVLPADGSPQFAKPSASLWLTSVGVCRCRGKTFKCSSAEATDRITLATLRKVAEAMGCDLIYGFVPKSGSFEELVERPCAKVPLAMCNASSTRWRSRTRNLKTAVN